MYQISDKRLNEVIGREIQYCGIINENLSKVPVCLFFATIFIVYRLVSFDVVPVERIDSI
jgi:hypothetical protein